MKALTEEQLQVLKQFDQLAKVEGSQNKACQKVGISGAILSTLKSGTYNGDADKQMQKLQDYFTLKEEAAMSTTIGGYVETSISKKVYGFIRNAQIKGGLIALSGDAGIGKTQAIRKYVSDHPHDSIWITANPCLNSVKPVLKALSRALNVIARTNDDMYIGIQDKLRDGVVLIFDEAQHLHLKTIEVLRGFSDYFADNGMTLGIIFIGNVDTINKFGGKQEAVFHQISNRTKQKPMIKATDIQRDDIKLLFPDLSDREAEIDFLWGIAQSAQAIRGATNLYSNASDNGDISYKGLVAMAKYMEMRL
ncbi:MAG: AAA family ATPase [Eubacterium sp.]